ncbi:MAG: MerR family transcriptional regulator [Rhizobacter sp.]|nr:MerR family transcriptional regulator [Rhizobacter sp.]
MIDSTSKSGIAHWEWVEEEVDLSLAQLSQASGCAQETIVELVSQGVLDPQGDNPQAWVFIGSSLRRTRVALRLIQELDVNPAGAAVAIDLLEQIDKLQTDLPPSTRH